MIAFPGLDVYVAPRVRMGRNVLIAPGAVIGGHRFDPVRTADGWSQAPAESGVVIGNNVAIGANTCIDDTVVIEDWVQIDNLVQVGHDCIIGAHTAIAGCTAIAGNTIIGRRCRIGGAVRIAGKLTICDDVVLLATSFVTKSITRPGIYSGSPAMPVRDWRRLVARVRRLR